MISSESNGQIKELVKLQKQARFRKKQAAFVVEGLKMVQEAARYGKLQKIFLSENLYGAVEKQDQQGEILSDLLASYNYEIIADAVLPG